MVARVFSAALTFAVPMVLARALLPAELGTFREAWLVVITLALVLPMTTPQSLYYFVPREPERSALFVGQALAFNLVVGLAGAGLVLAAGPAIVRHFGNPRLAAEVPWIALVTALMVASIPFDAAYNSVGRVRAAALVRLATEAGRGLAMVLGTLLAHSVRGLLAGIAAALAIRLALCWGLLLRAYGLHLSWKETRRQLRYALPFGLAAAIVIPQQQFHQYAVGAAVTASGFAIYAVGCFQLPIVDVLYTPISEILQIGLAEEERARPSRSGLHLFHEAVGRLALVFLPCMALLFVCAPDLIGFLFTDRYLAATPIFRLSIVNIALAALPLDGVMRARAQNRFMIAASAAKLAVTVPLVLGGLAWLGPVGAMAGWIAAETFGRGLLLWRTARIFDCGLRRVLPLRELLHQGIASLVALPAAFLALHLLPVTVLARLAAAGVLFGTAYLAVMWTRGWLPEGLLPPARRRTPLVSPTPVPPAE
jgi:O-antigen/teichoic acid export membrane protein